MKFKKLFFCLPLLITLVIAGTIISQPVLAAPSVIVSPKFGGPGTTVTVSGVNFSSYISDSVSVYFDSTTLVASSVNVSVNGTLQTTFTVPVNAKPGALNVSLRSKSGLVLAQDIFVLLSPSIRLNTIDGSVGMAVQASCLGFSAGKIVSIGYTFDTAEEILGFQTAGETGECIINITIPPFPQGEQTIVAQDSDGHLASVQFEVIPSTSIEPASASSGEIVNIYGSGFASGNQITIVFNGKIIALAKVDKRGLFDAQFKVPVLQTGTYLFMIRDNDGGKRWAGLTVVPRMFLNKTSGETGSNVTLSGTGFAISSVVSVRYDAQEIAGSLTDEKGAFQCNLIIPVSNAGSHVVTALDGMNFLQLIFKVESQAPEAPALLIPKRLTEVTAPIIFDWQSVYDISQPLVYTLEIARTDDFMQTVLRKTELSTSQYTLTNTENLLPNRRGDYYYWRVRATDGAGNIGEWSITVPFRVEPENELPLPAKYVLVLAMIIIIIIYGVQLRHGLRKKPPQKD